MSSNPLFELFLWAYKSVVDFDSEKAVAWLVDAPKVYEIWWRNLLQEAPQHILIETGLLLFIIWLVFVRRTVDPKKTSKNDKLSKKEIDWLLDTWQPEPLVRVEDNVVTDVTVIDRVANNYVSVQGLKNPVLNVSSFDFLDMSQDLDIKKTARGALDFYGCGSCGPRGFYGTIDQHLFFEEAIAKFMGTQEAICYSDGASAVSSAIAAFCKKGDLLLVDEACFEPILTGCNLSRSTVHFFKHNDMHDLRAILESIADDDKRLKRDTLQQRRFIISEGLFRNTGDICPLTEIVRLKEEFCYRLIVDESLSFGTLGKTGRGVTEHFSVSPSQVEIIVLTLDTTLASVGGVCIGTREIVDHQRLSGAGYCFSASAPPFLSAIASLALKKMEEQPKLLEDLKRNSLALFDKLKKNKTLKMLSTNATPVFCLVLQTPLASLKEEGEVIRRIAQVCVTKGVGVTASPFALTSRFGTERPSLTFCANSSLTEAEINKIVNVLTEATATCL